MLVTHRKGISQSALPYRRTVPTVRRGGGGGREGGGRREGEGVEGDERRVEKMKREREEGEVKREREGGEEGEGGR